MTFLSVHDIPMYSHTNSEEGIIYNKEVERE